MSDERYKKFLGIEPNDEVPTYYELFDVSRDEQDPAVLEKAYKTQIRKLQEIRTSKDKGFIEFLKEELRSAKRILPNPQKRKEYDEGLQATALEAFRGFVGSLMVMGHINKTLYDTMVQRGVADGLSEASAKSAIEVLAREHGATLETEASAPSAPAPGPSQDEDDLGYGDFEDPNSDFEDPNSGYDDSGYEYEDPEYADFAPQEAVLQAPPRPERPPPPPVTRPDARQAPVAEQAPPAGPWWRGVNERPPPWGRRTGSEFHLVKRPVRKGGPASAPRSKELDAAVRFYNLGAALAKVASDVHEKLRLYFPPGKAPTKTINGVAPQKVLDTEQSTYRECLKKFQTALDRVVDAEGGDADLIRVRATQSVSLVAGILDEIKAHKLRLMGGLPQQEEARAWQEFVGRSRPARLTRVID